MEIGVPKEIKAQEYRVGLTPAATRELTAAGHSVNVQSQAGAGAGFDDQLYRQAGAEVLEHAAEVFERSSLLVKVKEPQPVECQMLQPHHILFTYLHLAPDPKQAQQLLQCGAACIAYETVTDNTGALPLLAPMSEVAGRLSIQAAAHSLEKARGGCGVLLGGVAGVAPANVLVLGGGVVGLNAARMALGLGARVTIIDKSLPRLKTIDELFRGQITTLYATEDAIETNLRHAHAVIGAVLVPGASAPKLVTREMLSQMHKGAVLVDVAIDQGGCFATSHATTHQQPTYIVDDIVHYCVANMPGAVAQTSTSALTNATLPYVLQLAEHGLDALKDSPGLQNGLNIARGKVTHAAVAQALGEEYVAAEQALGWSEV